ncbi:MULTISPECIES: carboxymuconolactone decarboxylase family protein [unclassified Brenneria]|uniref:carboxymuconolactone decarboxylase family protein n=1 Tax=unclassified Brenneria TaxID=2634434 RepID=UPI0018F063CE|nr:carboxymuconolactone decarboxylase family protein [Brenneria sp. L3-3C-1]MBJ7223539.1 carboxymuconolactone decarboxylase family protein [Brenneria sp. L3-3C-1]MEE3644780.1 carboxymuconolactone decarboxylase family protein [Brenneria sp. L3_3C_1]
MSIFKRHTIDSAPEKSKALLQSSIDNFGWIPNQSAYMAESPSLLAAYQRAHDLFIDSSLTEEEKAVVWITCGVENNCAYTVQAHAFIALSKGVDARVVDAVAHAPANLDARLLALHNFTLKVIHCRGRLGKKAMDAVVQAGFSKQNMLDVVLGISQKNMSTILNNIAGTEIDSRFKWDAFRGIKQTGEA